MFSRIIGLSCTTTIILAFVGVFTISEQCRGSDPTYVEISSGSTKPSKDVPAPTSVIKNQDPSNWSLGLGVALWQELLSGQANSTSGTYKSVFYASQWSARKALESSLLENSDWKIYGEGSLFLGQVNLQNQDSSLPNYYRRGANFQGLGLALGFVHFFPSQTSYWGLSLPVIHRQAQLDPLISNAGSPRFENKQKLFFSALLEWGWQMDEHWSLIQNIGTGADLRDALWQIRLFYK